MDDDDSAFGKSLLPASDPTGLSHRMLMGMKKKLYPAPDALEYYMPSMGEDSN